MSKNENGKKTHDMTAIKANFAPKPAKIRTNQRKAIECLLSGGTVQQAAIVADVQERTVYNWKTQENFKQALQQAQTEVLDSAVTALSGATIDAVRVLRDIANDTEAPPATRVSAARAILDSAIRLKELHDLEQRVQALERMQQL